MDYGSAHAAPTSHPIEDGLAPSDEIKSMQEHQKAFSTVILICAFGLISVGGILLSSSNWDSVRDVSTNPSSFLVKSESTFAPLVLQETTHENLIPKFFEKFGFNGDEDSSSTNFSSIKGWAVIDLYTSAECSGTVYSKGGIATGTCINVYGYNDAEYEQSLIVECTNGEVILHMYDDSDCTTALFTKKVGSEGCSALDSSKTTTSWYANAECQASGNIPLQGSYNLFKAYVDRDPGSCKSSVLFEATPVETCVPTDWEGSDHSVVFNHKNLDPFMEIYNNAADCTGKADRADLETDCGSLSTQNPSFPVDADISYTWEYYDSRGR